MKSKLDVYRGITEAHRELQGPGVTLVVHNTVHVNITNIANALQSCADGFQHLIRELRGTNEARYRSSLAAIWTQSASEKTLFFEVFFPAIDKAIGAEPGATSELDTLDPLLDNEPLRK
jgi:hypothetical protein